MHYMKLLNVGVNWVLWYIANDGE